MCRVAAVCGVTSPSARIVTSPNRCGSANSSPASLASSVHLSRISTVERHLSFPPLAERRRSAVVKPRATWLQWPSPSSSTARRSAASSLADHPPRRDSSRSGSVACRFRRRSLTLSPRERQRDRTRVRWACCVSPARLRASASELRGEREELTRLRGVARQLEDGGDHGEAERGREVVRVVCGEELGEAAEALLGGQARERSGIGDDGVSGMSGTFAVIRAITVSRTIGIVSFIGTI